METKPTGAMLPSQRAIGENPTAATNAVRAVRAKGEMPINPARLRAFLRGVEKPAGIDGCWIWRRSLNCDGYPSGMGSGMPVHRVAYEWMVGPIPSGLELDHLCRNRACVNPHHLEPVTKSENCQRRTVPGRAWSPRRYCRKGHAQEGDNVRVWSGGRGRGPRVYCLACIDARKQVAA